MTLVVARSTTDAFALAADRRVTDPEAVKPGLL
jgi:hypothetical protein